MKNPEVRTTNDESEGGLSRPPLRFVVPTSDFPSGAGSRGRLGDLGAEAAAHHVAGAAVRKAHARRDARAGLRDLQLTKQRGLVREEGEEIFLPGFVYEVAAVTTARDDSDRFSKFAFYKRLAERAAQLESAATEPA